MNIYKKKKKQQYLGLILEFWIDLAKWKQSVIQFSESILMTGCKISESHLPSLCCTETINDKIGQSRNLKRP